MHCELSRFHAANNKLALFLPADFHWKLNIAFRSARNVAHAAMDLIPHTRTKMHLITLTYKLLPSLTKECVRACKYNHSPTTLCRLYWRDATPVLTVLLLRRWGIRTLQFLFLIPPFCVYHGCFLWRWFHSTAQRRPERPPTTLVVDHAVACQCMHELPTLFDAPYLHNFHRVSQL